MNHFINVFTAECRKFFEQPKRLFYVLVLPFLLFGFFAALFSAGVARKMPMGYIDRDQSQTSQSLVRMLGSTPSMDLCYSLRDEEEAKRLIQQQKIMGFVSIPQDFQRGLYKGDPQQVVCYLNSQFMLPSGVIQKDFQTTVGMFGAGSAMKKQLQKGVQTARVRAEAQPVLVDDHPLFNPYSNYAFYLLTALFPMLLQMVVVMSTIYALGIDLRNQQGAAWLEAAGGNPFIALVGRTLPYTLCLFFVGWWMNHLLFGLIGTPLHIPMSNVVLLTFAFVVIYQIMAIAFVSFAPDFRAALTIGSGFTALAFSFAAYTYPIEGLPFMMRIVAQLFPFTHFVEYFVNRAVKGVPFAMAWEGLFSLLLFALLFALAYPRFVKHLKAGGYEKN